MRCKRSILVLIFGGTNMNKLCLKIFGIAQVLSDFERSRVQKYLSSYGHWRHPAVTSCWVFPCWLHGRLPWWLLTDWDVSRCQVWLVNTTGAGSNDGKLYLGWQKSADLDLEMNISWNFSVKDLEMVPMTRMTQMFLVVSWYVIHDLIPAAAAVVLLDQLYVLLDAVLLMMSLQNFASHLVALVRSFLLIPLANCLIPNP